MAARDRFTRQITCPKCGVIGTAEVSEDDHPYMRSPGFSVDDLPPGFKVEKESNWRHETYIKCDCGEVFHL